MKKEYLITLALMLVSAGVAFAGGVKFQERRQPKLFEGVRQGANGQRSMSAGSRNGGANMQFRQGSRPVMGEIIAQDDKSLTLKLTDGSSKIVLLGEAATVQKAMVGTQEDLKNGEFVLITGTENEDGSVTAQTVQLNPPQRSTEAAQPQQ